MKQRVELTEDEMKEAIIEFVRKKTGIEVKSATLNYHASYGNDPRERSYYSAYAE